jgi:glycosyltransferase involved in cell wall biosynthesis
MLSQREGFSIATLESLSLGIPVICFNGKDNAATDLIENNINGIKTNLEEKNIKDAIYTIYNNYNFFSTNAMKVKNKYSYTKITKDLTDIYTTVKSSKFF